MMRASSGSVSLDRLDEALDRGQRLLLARLLGHARVAGEVGERDRHAQAPEVERFVLEVGLHVADDVLLDEVLQEALVEVVHDRRGQRQQLAGQALHLLGHLEPGRRRRASAARARRGGTGAPRRRRSGPAPGRRRARAAGRRRAGSRRRARRRRSAAAGGRPRSSRPRSPAGKPIDCQMRSISAGSSPVSRGGVLERVLAVLGREQVLDVAEGQPARPRPPGGSTPASGRARAAGPRCGRGDRGGRPAAVGVGDHPLIGPAPKRPCA